LILGSNQLPAQPIAVQGAAVAFDASAMASGVYWARLRVDGVDSLLVDRSDPKSPRFDPSQQITIT
jgi:hypothetical protein